VTIDLPKLSGGVLSAEGKLVDRDIMVTLSGTADVEARADLDAFVHKVHAESLRLGVPKVVVDLHDLEFMNSGCFKIFVAWLAQVRDLAPAQQYRVHLRSNPNLLWQRRSLAALSYFAVDLVAIET
jgi:hypothetical protein